MKKLTENTILYRFFMIFMVVVLLFGLPLHALADIDDDIDDLTSEREETQQQLDEAYASIEELAASQESVNTELDDTSNALVQLMAELEVIEEMISDKEAEIVVATENYNQAVQHESEQYDSMKVRIKYLYEAGGQDLISIYMETGSISETLTKADYVEDLYEYDRQMLADYQETAREVQQLKNDLEIEKDELVTMQLEYEMEQQYMEEVIDELKAISDSYAVEISAAKNQAAAYAEKLKAQNKEIKRLQDEKKAEEARKKAEEEAARKKAEEAKKKAEEEKKKAGQNSESDNAASDNAASDDGANNSTENNADNNDTANTNNDSTDDPANSDNSDSNNNVDEEARDKAEQEADKNQKYDVSSIYNAKGSELGKKIAVYGCKFIGNPYVPGGTSLTNGADCSGFVYALYKEFGYSVPRTSYALRSAGREVSYADAEPGDVICYTGHVAIYLGNNMIVHASTISTGIKVSYAQYRPILTVRRII